MALSSPYWQCYKLHTAKRNFTWRYEKIDLRHGIGMCAMLINGILNPQINSLLARVRHTNMLVIADRGFPFWPMIETVDISLVDDVPTVLQVFQAIRLNFEISEIFMAEEFSQGQFTRIHARLLPSATAHIPLTLYGARCELKKHVPGAIGLIRTGDTIQYANMILVSGPIESGQELSSNHYLNARGVCFSSGRRLVYSGKCPPAISAYASEKNNLWPGIP